MPQTLWMDPAELRFSQTTAGGRGRVQALAPTYEIDLTLRRKENLFPPKPKAGGLEDTIPDHGPLPAPSSYQVSFVCRRPSIAVVHGRTRLEWSSDRRRSHAGRRRGR